MADSDLCVLELVPWHRVTAQPHLLAMVTWHADIVNTTHTSLPPPPPSPSSPPSCPPQQADRHHQRRRTQHSCRSRKQPRSKKTSILMAMARISLKQTSQKPGQFR